MGFFDSNRIYSQRKSCFSIATTDFLAHMPWRAGAALQHRSSIQELAVRRAQGGGRQGADGQSGEPCRGSGEPGRQQAGPGRDGPSCPAG